MLFERKARNFNHLCNGMLFALLLSTSSLQFGPNLEAPKKLECKNSELEQVMIPLLRGRVFHVTKQKTFDEICRSGWIYSERQAEFAFTPARAENSYGRKRGWVSLYDLRSPTDAEIKEALIRYSFLKTTHNESTHAYLIVAESAWPSLISWKRAIREVGGKEFFIPFVEAWYPGDMPLQLVNESLVVTVHLSPR